MSRLTLSDVVASLRQQQPIPESDNPLSDQLQDILTDLLKARANFSPETDLNHDLLRFHVKRAQTRVVSLLAELHVVQAELNASPSTTACVQGPLSAGE